MFTLPSKTRICFRMFVCVPSSFKTCRLRTKKTISQAHLMNWVNWAKKWTSLQKKMLCFLENEGKKRRLQINIPSRNVFSMPLVEKSILTVSLRFQMMTTTFVSEINYHFYKYFSDCFFRRVCYGFYTGLNRETNSFSCKRCSPVGCIWAAPFVIVFRHSQGSLNSVIVSSQCINLSFMSINEDH